jgi:hypothetical protein
MGGPMCAANHHLAAAYQIQHDAVVSWIQVLGIRIDTVLAADDLPVLDGEYGDRPARPKCARYCPPSVGIVTL